MVVFEELALQGHTVVQVCDAIKLVNVKHARNLTGVSQPLMPQWYVIDPAARNVAHQTGRSDQMEYTQHGIVTIAGQNSVTAGINRVRERLETNRLFITANCVELLKEIRRYRWKSPARTESDPKEAPVKRDDHLLDALRYIVMSQPFAAQQTEQHGNLSPLEERARLDQQGRRDPYRNIPKTPMGGVFA
jgi:hypothetical protein